MHTTPEYGFRFVPFAAGWIRSEFHRFTRTLSEFFPVGAEVDTADLSGPHSQLLTMHFNGYPTQINGFSLTQISGPSCSPTITAPGRYPVVLGDIPTSGSGSGAFTVSIVDCNPNSQFTLSVPWSSPVYHTGTFTTTLDFKRGNRN
jgi:hypothetical protein